MKEKKRIVVIGGGTGTYTVLSGLKKHEVELSAVVSMADDGGSSRILREEFGVLPPGSVRPALVALSNAEKSVADLFSFRFSNGSLKEHNIGNLLLTALAQNLGSFEKAIEEAGKILNIKGRVIPSTLENVRLMAELENGEVIKGETNIDIPAHDGNLKIEKIWLEPTCKANPKAVEAILEADAIVIGPGDLFTSIIPNFLVDGISEACSKTKAKKIYVCNIMTKFGETSGFSSKDFLNTIEKYLKDGIQYMLVNTKTPLPERIKTYEKEQAEFVVYAPEDFKDSSITIVEKDLLRPNGFIRHDSDVLAQSIMNILK
ncbi:MAG: YvcK family protein [Patescibacteria group bacterium]|nr:YvcK family protein [Patescibacteria group bacterium]